MLASTQTVVQYCTYLRKVYLLRFIVTSTVCGLIFGEV